MQCWDTQLRTNPCNHSSYVVVRQKRSSYDALAPTARASESRCGGGDAGVTRAEVVVTAANRGCVPADAIPFPVHSARAV